MSLNEILHSNSLMKHTLLCVDDEVDNVDSLERLFRKKYRVLKATTPEDALKLLDQNQVTVIISDQRMPNMSGTELLAESIKTHPFAVRILLTGYTDIESVIAAINSGQVYRYVNKPWDPVDLSTAVDRAVERFEMGEELREKNRALSQALTELQTLDQAKTEFMLLVNHELKTPLTSILSFGDLLAETKLDQDQKRYLSRVKAAAARLQEMVSDVLEFISAQTALTKVVPKKISAQNLSQPVPEFIQTLVANRGQQLNFEIEKQNLLVDEKIIRNVVRRILHNAAKFGDANSEIMVSGGVVDRDHFEFRFVNAAPAIEESKIRQIFKPFTLNENALNHSTGNGLGLSVCQALLSLHGSKLELTSEGHKVEVSFKLPLAP